MIGAMPYTAESRTTVYPIEVLLGLLFISIIGELVARDENVVIFFFAFLPIIYPLYRILRTVELIAAKL